MAQKKTNTSKIKKTVPAENEGTLKRESAFDEVGFKATIERLGEEIRELYRADDVPWIIGYSGGKDSTAVLQLIWNALEGLPVEERHKKVHVISTDTMVENPIVSAWVEGSHNAMRERAKELEMPIKPRLLRPKVDESFWVNLIGRGYPAPRHKFRWCTERLKIKPSNRFISNVVTQNGEAILCLGVRSAESKARSKVMEKNRRYRVRDRLSPSATLAGCLIYSPVEAWTNDDVWVYLNRVKNPWGITNKDLLGMYAGASPDGECPLVVDDTTPSCGDSRFGCWVCTLVEKDKSMTAMRDIAAGPLPLLLVEDLLEQAENQARAESQIKQNRVLGEALSERDELILEKLKNSKLDAKAVSQIRKTLNEDRRERTVSAQEPLILDANEHLPAHLAHLRGRVLPEAKKEADAGIDRVRRLEEKISRIESELGRVPEEDSIAKFQEALESARQAHAEKMAELDTMDARLEALKRRREEAVRQVDRFGEQDSSARLAEDDRQRILKHSKRVRTTLDKFRVKVIERHVANMEALMLEPFQELLRKEDHVHGLRIDPESFEVTLMGKHGKTLSFDRLSAGERQLLATAMLWGLARASGRPIPTVIDTPLGRLDSSHRKHLVERYFPKASHQVLLLSTDEAIVGRYHMKPSVVCHYQFAA